MISEEKILSLIRNVPDFPEKGIIFKDITPLLADGLAFKAVMDEFAARCKGKKINKVVGIESRGFIFASALAHALGVGFIPARKSGKLPCKTICEDFSLEYNTDKIEMHTDALSARDKIVIVDDVLATGGTMKAAINLARKLGAQIDSCIFLGELEFFRGRNNIDIPIEVLVKL